MIDHNTIIISVHPCKNLAKRVIELYNITNSPALVLIPCCSGKVPNEYKKKDEHTCESWANYLYSLIDSNNFYRNILQDNKCLSERNIIISAMKRSLTN
jgi:hypothetical protein